MIFDDLGCLLKLFVTDICFGFYCDFVLETYLCAVIFNFNLIIGVMWLLYYGWFYTCCIACWVGGL